jgi:hypothetical protein
VDDSKWERAANWGGILFVVLVAVAAFIPGSPPKPSDGVGKIVKYFADHHDAVQWAGYIGALAVIPLLWWLGSVWRLMRINEGGSPRLTVSAFAGAVFAAAMATIGGVAVGAVALERNFIGAQGLKFFYVLTGALTSATLIGIVVFVGSVSVVVLRTNALPRLLGWFGALVSLVAIVGAAATATDKDAIFFAGFAGFIGFLLWVLATSILMMRAKTGEAAPRPAASAA